MLKVELHTHIDIDPVDKPMIKYSAKQLVDLAIGKKFDVLAITCHNLVYQNDRLKEYAMDKGLLLIYGIERDIEGRHVLIYGIMQEEADGIKTFSDLKRLKEEKAKIKENIFVIAPHPFYWGGTCLGDRIIKHLDLFDAWEFANFHTKIYNKPNQKVLRFAKQHNKPVVGNSDLHHVYYFNRTYSLIDTDKNEKAVFEAIRNNKVKIVSKPMSLFEFVGIFFWAIYSKGRKQGRKLLNTN